MAQAVSSPIKKLCAQVSKNNNEVYLADSDGFVIAQWSGSGSADIIGLTDGSNPPTTVSRRDKRLTYISDNDCVGFTMPVIKGNYWKVTGAAVVSWMPFK